MYREKKWKPIKFKFANEEIVFFRNETFILWDNQQTRQFFLFFNDSTIRRGVWDMAAEYSI